MERKHTAILYHASPVSGITTLEPRVSNHNIPLIYFSRKRENVLVYLSNAVEKYCGETSFPHEDKWYKWGPYGFGKDGRLRLEEYYPHALESTYQGVPGYIYSARDVEDSGHSIQIPDAVTSSVPVDVCGCEFVPDAYQAILNAEREGLITILRYHDITPKMAEWIKQAISEEYQNTDDEAYRHFLRGNFPQIIENLFHG